MEPEDVGLKMNHIPGKLYAEVLAKICREKIGKYGLFWPGANQFGVSHPVVDDTNAQVTNAYGTGGYYPNLHIIGQGMEVVLRYGSGSTKPSRSDIEAVLAQME